MTPGRREAIILGAAGIAATAAGFLVGPLLTGPDTDNRLWEASFKDLQAKDRRLVEWRGKVLVCNFWATWCAPCVEEIPLLMASREKHQHSGLEIVGIAIDQVAKVQQFAAKLSVTYPILISGGEGLDLLKDAGNPSGGLPFTLISDRTGRWVGKKLGAYRGLELEDVIKPLLAK